MIKNYFILLTSALLLAPLLSFGQNGDEDKHILKLAEATCNCAKGKDFSSMSRQQMELELGVCILNALNENKDAKNALGIDVGDSEGVAWLGEQIGYKMAEVCPQEILTIGLLGMSEEDTEAGMDQEHLYSYEVKGKLKAIEPGQFNYLVIEDEEGKEVKLIWLGYFEGSDILINAPEKAVGKSVTAQYTYIECFSPERKEYYDEMEITYLQFTE